MSIKKFIKKMIPKRVLNKMKERGLKIIKNRLRNTECIYKINVEDTKKLEGKVAIVTGGSGAIGSAICFKLAMEGAYVFVAGRNVENLNSVVNQIKNNNGKAEALVLDVTEYKDIEEKFEYVISKHNKIDILVNNAGGSARANSKLLVEQDIEVIDMILDTNLRGTIICSKFAAKYMIAQNYGKIVNIGSTTGVQGNSNNVDYSAAKSGVIGVTKSLAKELGKNNINVNCVSPGRVNQIIFDKILEDIKDDGCYLERMGKTDDIANVVEFLVSENSNYILGQNIIVDGGRSLGLRNS